MVANKSMITLIKKNEGGRFVYRGTTTAEVIGYPTDTSWEIWDDMERQKTYHIAKK
jgi:hypothetical protein